MEYILNEYGVSLYSSSLLLIGCYLKKKFFWSASCGNSMCSGCAGGLQGYSEEKSSTGPSPRKQTQNQIEVPTLQLHTSPNKPSPSADKLHNLPSKESGKHMWSTPRVKPQGWDNLWVAPVKQRSSGICRAKVRAEQRENSPQHPFHPPGQIPYQKPSKAPGWQKLRLSRLSPRGDLIGTSLLWVSDSKLPSPDLRGLEQIHFRTLSYSCANSSPGHKHLCTFWAALGFWGFLVSQAHQTAGTASSERDLVEELQ